MEKKIIYKHTWMNDVLEELLENRYQVRLMQDNINQVRKITLDPDLNKYRKILLELEDIEHELDWTYQVMEQYGEDMYRTINRIYEGMEEAHYMAKKAYNEFQ